MTKRNKKGEVVHGRGSELTTLQSEFLDRVASEGMESSGKIAKDLNYTSYYRDRRNHGTAFHRELMALANAEMKSIEAAVLLDHLQIDICFFSSFDDYTSFKSSLLSLRPVIDLMSQRCVFPLPLRLVRIEVNELLHSADP